MFLDDATERALDQRSLRQGIGDAEGLGAKLAALGLWVKATRLFRANARYLIARGNLMAGGIAYTALISITAALVIGWTIFMAVLGGNERLRNTVLDSINDFLPNLIGYGEGFLLNPDSLILDSPVNVVSVVTTALLLWSALALMAAIRLSVRQVFAISAIPESFVVMKLRDALGFLGMAVAVLLTSALSIAVVTIGGMVFEWLGIEGAGAQRAIHATTLGVSFLVDLLTFVLVIRFVAGARPPRNDLYLGAAIGAVATGVLRYAGSALISVPDNALFTSFVTLGTLLVWVNLIARLLLYVAAFIANPPAPVKPKDPAEVHFYERPNYVTLSVPETLQWQHQPATGSIIPDPSLNPNAPPEPEPEPEPEPRWGGLIGAVQRRRMERIERKLERARESYFR
ncbi:MAG: YihY/virulence factor BrkB family protein [Ruaniaceae bacterium]|nr:YihY/virulence factor BrkB family protein [Ruaniaceae bacterium]